MNEGDSDNYNDMGEMGHMDDMGGGGGDIYSLGIGGKDMYAQPDIDIPPTSAAMQMGDPYQFNIDTANIKKPTKKKKQPQKKTKPSSKSALRKKNQKSTAGGKKNVKFGKNLVYEIELDKEEDASSDDFNKARVEDDDDEDDSAEKVVELSDLKKLYTEKDLEESLNKEDEGRLANFEKMRNWKPTSKEQIIKEESDSENERKDSKDEIGDHVKDSKYAGIFKDYLKSIKDINKMNEGGSLDSLESLLQSKDSLKEKNKLKDLKRKSPEKEKEKDKIGEKSIGDDYEDDFEDVSVQSTQRNEANKISKIQEEENEYKEESTPSEKGGGERIMDWKAFKAEESAGKEESWDVKPKGKDSFSSENDKPAEVVLHDTRPKEEVKVPAVKKTEEKVFTPGEWEKAQERERAEKLRKEREQTANTQPKDKALPDTIQKDKKEYELYEDSREHDFSQEPKYERSSEINQIKKDRDRLENIYIRIRMEEKNTQTEFGAVPLAERSTRECILEAALGEQKNKNKQHEQTLTQNEDTIMKLQEQLRKGELENTQVNKENANSAETIKRLINENKENLHKITLYKSKSLLFFINF